jgi:hypothetical protein
MLGVSVKTVYNKLVDDRGASAVPSRTDSPRRGTSPSRIPAPPIQ